MICDNEANAGKAEQEMLNKIPFLKKSITPAAENRDLFFQRALQAERVFLFFFILLLE